MTHVRCPEVRLGFCFFENSKRTSGHLECSSLMGSRCPCVALYIFGVAFEVSRGLGRILGFQCSDVCLGFSCWCPVVALGAFPCSILGVAWCIGVASKSKPTSGRPEVKNLNAHLDTSKSNIYTCRLDTQKSNF